MNLRNKIRSGDLAAPTLSQKATELLEGLANLPDGDDALKWFRTNFPYVLVDLKSRLVRKHTESGDSEECYDYYAFCLDEESKYKYLLLPLRATLRAIWLAPDRRTKEWGMFRVSKDFFHQGDGSLIHGFLDNSSDFLLTQVSPPSRTERLLLEFVRLAELTRFCSNPDCSTPYFIARRRSQKYCSELCSKHAQREFKQRWWAENGPQWRAAKARHQAKNKKNR